MTQITNDDFAQFRQEVADIKPLKQDKRHFKATAKDKVLFDEKGVQIQADSYFSDTYQPLLPTEGPMRWCSENTDKMELKRLRRGDYIPELLLDLHGCRQAEAKLELAALIQACVKQSCHCCCVMHGHGNGILKQQLPNWLVQHPKVTAFHQSPKEWGGDAALIVLIEIDDINRKY